MIDRLYADAYPTEVKGMVLVDATHGDIAFGEKRFRDLAAGKTIPGPQSLKSGLPPTHFHEPTVVLRLIPYARHSAQAVKLHSRSGC
jgi:hypothetical protein